MSGFAKVDPTCEAKVELVYLVWWLWLSFDLIHDLSIFNRLLLCSLNPGISLIFESRYLQPRVLPLPLLSIYIFISSAITRLSLRA